MSSRFNSVLANILDLIDELKLVNQDTEEQIAKLNNDLQIANDKVTNLQLDLDDCKSQLPSEVPQVVTETYLTSVVLNESTSTVNGETIISFGLPFAKSSYKIDNELIAKQRIAQSDGGVFLLLPIQVDVKSYWPDDSIRHAIVTVKINPSVGNKSIDLFISNQLDENVYPLIEYPKTDDIVFNLTIGNGEILYKFAVEGFANTWLSGHLVREDRIYGKLVSSDGQYLYPDLLPFIDLRVDALGNRQASFIIENTYHDWSAPVTYDLAVGFFSNLSTIANIQQYHHTRYRKVVTSNNNLSAFVYHDHRYLASTGAIPNYDSRTVPQAAIDKIVNKWQSSNLLPMSNGLVHHSWSDPGGRIDIGPLPGWAVTALLSKNESIYKIMLDCADRSGVFSFHYRDRGNNRIYNIFDHPTATLNEVNARYSKSQDKINLGGTSPYNIDRQHQPSLVYLPYLLTGDRFYLDELLFTAHSNLLSYNFNSRQQSAGIIGSASDPARAQAWTIRSLINLHWVMPDDNSMSQVEKSNILNVINNNITWYYSNLPLANNIGAWSRVTFAIDKYPDEVAWMYRPWQIDFLAVVWRWLIAAGYNLINQSTPNNPDDMSLFVARWFAQNVIKRHNATLLSSPADSNGKQLLLKEQAHGYDLAGGLKSSDQWIEDWFEVARLTPIDYKVWRPQDTFHYQAIARAAAACALDLQVLDSQIVYTQLDLYCETFSANYDSDPTWCIVPKLNAAALTSNTTKRVGGFNHGFNDSEEIELRKRGLNSESSRESIVKTLEEIRSRLEKKD